MTDDSMGHCQKNNISNKHVSNSEWLPRQSCLHIQMKNTRHGNREKLLTDHFNLTYDRFFCTETKHLLHFTIEVEVKVKVRPRTGQDGSGGE